MRPLVRVIMFDAAIIAFSILTGTSHAAPAPAACADQFYQGQMPNTANPSTSFSVTVPGRNHMLCFDAFGVTESGITKTPLWSAEHLTAARVTAAKSVPRKNKFHSEKQIPPGDEAKLADYLESHYDRGHMSPDDDMPDAESQFQSFSLANMVPQNSCNNEIIWKAIETAVRNYVLAHGEVYVVTGPIFDGMPKTIGADHVYVPSRLFKAVYDPVAKSMIIVITPNENVQTYTTMTASELLAATGVEPFPGVTDPSLLALPVLPKISGQCKKE